MATATSASTETVYVSEKEVACDGGKGALGHPLVYLNMGTKEQIVCPYCNKKFVFKEK